MIAVGGVIGTGLFIGSGTGIHDTGPGIVLSYVLAGLLVVAVSRMLGEMAAASPDTGSFSSYADRAIGRWAGFGIGWLYWWAWVVTLAIEATAGALVVHHWLPNVPQWTFALLFMLVFTTVNIVSVANFGAFEYWFSMVKVTAILLFIGLGLLAILGLLPTTASPGLSNLTGPGGVFPHGPTAVITVIPAVVFAYGGTEIATIAAAEAHSPHRAVGRAIAQTVWRVVIFFVGSMAVVVVLLPWNSSGLRDSPYVAALDRIGVPGASRIMDVVVLVAVLSCLNSGIYTTSRMAYSLAERGDGPAILARTSHRGVPIAAVLVSVAFGFVAVFLNYLSPETVFIFLLNSGGSIQLFVWLVTAISQLRLRPHLEATHPGGLPVRMWGYPYLTWITITTMTAILVAMALAPDSRPKVVGSLALGVVIVIVALLRRPPGSAASEEVL
ncbi:amino acid permease [Actinomadura logoneensis]|nr:amino acid permease [Actinomadura logoneensis]